MSQNKTEVATLKGVALMIWAMILLAFAMLYLVATTRWTSEKVITDPHENEARALTWAVAHGQEVPEIGGEEFMAVTPVDLVKSFMSRYSPYEGAMVYVPMRSVTIKDGAVRWWVGSRDKSPSIVFMLAAGEQPIDGRCWIVGRCTGRIEDGETREWPDLDYYVLVEDCHLLR